MKVFPEINPTPLTAHNYLDTLMHIQHLLTIFLVVKFISAAVATDCYFRSRTKSIVFC